jgi:hypothetical protein
MDSLRWTVYTRVRLHVPAHQERIANSWFVLGTV